MSRKPTGIDGPRAKRVGLIAAVLVGLGSPRCLVEQRCQIDADCPGQQICAAAGNCILECSVGTDCEAAFGSEFDCQEGRCQRAHACTACAISHAEHSCVRGDCQFLACLTDYFDRDQDLSNGCEYLCKLGTVDANGDPSDGCECTPAGDGVELCNGLDDDCDGGTDEDFALLTNAAHCGACGHRCAAGPHAVPRCAGGQCLYGCEPGFFDNDGQAGNGCEAAFCAPVPEICNGRDDDCDCPGDTDGNGVECDPGDAGVDEGFDKTAVGSCGPYCVDCRFPNALPSCTQGSCQLASCQEGYFDLDSASANGCEYACIPTGEEKCNAIDDDCDGLVDEGEICRPSCPPDMVAVGAAYCIDRYEASRGDASSTAQGVDTAQAYSRAGVLPWMVNPMTAAHLAEFERACSAAGKHLCSSDEWLAACAGPDPRAFVYGNTFDREACNCVDTFCDDYCAEHGNTNCSTSSNCGYTYSCFHETPTGRFAGCTNSYGTFDINGNVWEIVSSTADARGYEIRGGAFNCAGASTRVNCGFNANWAELYAGFRCCKSVE